MKLTYKLAALFVVFPLAAFAKNQVAAVSSAALKNETVSTMGTNSGGGGDPQDLEEFKISDKMKSILRTIEKNVVWLKGDDKPTGLNAEQSQRLAQLQNVQAWFKYAAKNYKVFSAIGYPFVNAQYSDEKLKAITSSVEDITFVHGSNLQIEGGRVTFISNPSTRTVQVDYSRFSKFFGSSARWVPQDEVKPMAIKMLTIAMHEFMVLQNLERSRTYDASSEFGELLTLTFSGDSFWRWAMQNLSFFQACPYKGNDSSKAEVKPDVELVATYLYRESQMRFSAASNYNLKGSHPGAETELPPTELSRLIMAEIYSGVEGASVAVEDQFLRNKTQKCGK